MKAPNEALRAFWERLERRRDKESHLSGLLEELSSSVAARADRIELLEALVEHPVARHQLGEIVSPVAVASFFAELARRIAPGTILDPTCGVGLTLFRALEAAPRARGYGVEVGEVPAKIAQALLGDRAAIRVANTLLVSGDELFGIDLIVADPPMNFRVAPDGSARKRDFVELLIEWSLPRLAPSGMMAVVIAPRLTWDRAFHAKLNSLGARLRALVHVPAGSRLSSSISSYIAVIDRGEQGNVFIAQVAPEGASNQTLVENFIEERLGKHPSLGAWIPLGEFHGFEPFADAHAMRARFHGTRLVPAPMASIIHSIDRCARKPSGADAMAGEAADPNSLFIWQQGSRVMGAVIPPDRASSVMKLQLVPGAVDVPYFLHWLQSELGQSVPWRAFPQSAVPERVLASTAYLHPAPDQQRIATAIGGIERLRHELGELEQACWEGKEPPFDALDRVQQFTVSESYEEWLETLPFPIATVLWRHHAMGSEDARVRIKILSDFFEACAAFLATLHLSAFTSSRILWAEHQPAVRSALAKQHLRVELATFGSWRCFVDVLGKRARGLLRGDTSDVVKQAYATTDDAFLAALVSPVIGDLLGKANGIRNRRLGHGGAMSHLEAEEVERQFLQLRDELRAHFGGVWQRHELVLPGAAPYRDGLFCFNMPRIMGTRTQFISVKRETTEPLEAGALYLLEQGAARGLKVLPFVKVLASPPSASNSCYFFSREQAGELSFVSYHQDERSEMAAPFPDAKQALQMLVEPAGQLPGAQ